MYQIIRRLRSRTKTAPLVGKAPLTQGLTLTQPLRRRMEGEENTFTFLNLTKRFDPAHFDWTAAEMGKLWTYNLHYFDYLLEEGRSWNSSTFLLDDWLKNNFHGSLNA